MTARTAAEWTAPPRMPETHYVAGDVYTDPEIHAAEIEGIFNRVWRPVCHISELPETYDYRLIDHCGTPLFCIRGEDGVIRTFVNACSHRGAKLLHEPAGNAPTITCFYHRWTYDAGGACTGIARAAAYRDVGIGTADMGLRQVRTEVLHGLVFITMDDEAPPLEDFLCGALDGFAAPLAGAPLEVFHYNRSVIDANWKAWHETNMDLYHEYMHVVLRKTQLKAMPMEARQLHDYGNGHAGSGGLKAAYDGYQGFKGRGTGEVPPLPGMDEHAFQFVDLFPGTAIIARGTVIRIDTVTPLGPDKALVEMRGLGLAGESDADRAVRMRHHNQYWGPFGRNVPEDLFAAEACDEAFRHGGARYQIIAREEQGTGQDDIIMRAFYREWAARTGLSPAAPGRAAASQAAE